MQTCHIRQGMWILTESSGASSEVQLMYIEATETVMVGGEREESHAVMLSHGIWVEVRNIECCLRDGNMKGHRHWADHDTLQGPLGRLVSVANIIFRGFLLSERLLICVLDVYPGRFRYRLPAVGAFPSKAIQKMPVRLAFRCFGSGQWGLQCSGFGCTVAHDPDSAKEYDPKASG